MSREKALAAARRAVAEVLREKGCVTMVDVFVTMGRLTPAQVEDWRFGRVPYLERVVQGSLAQLSAIGREVRAACEAMGLEPSSTVYRTWGRGPKRPLRFSRSGEPAIERAYSTVWTSEAFRRGMHQELDGTRRSCYSDRPKDCRSYPHLHKKDMTSRSLGVLGNAAVCPIVFSTLERLKAELLERGFDWRAEEGGEVRSRWTIGFPGSTATSRSGIRS